MRTLAFTIALCLSTLPLCAQEREPPQTSTLTVTTRLVSVDAIVRDAHGDLVKGLDKDAFALREDGHPVPIRYFNRDSDLPLTVGLLIDTSGSETEYFGNEELASNLFLENVLRPPPATTPTGPPYGHEVDAPTDRAFILRFDSQIVLLQPMTSNLQLLRNGLRLLDYKRDPDINTTHGGTLLYDAIVNVCTKIIATETGRRALIIMTDGDDEGSTSSRDDAIRSAQTAGVAVYSILYTTEDTTHIDTAHPSGIRVMQQISRATGGRAFVVGSKMTIRQIYSTIEDDLRSQYRLGFTPQPSKPHKFHSLDLRINIPALTIQSRSSYSTPE